MSGPLPENKSRPLELALALPALVWLAAAAMVLVAVLGGYRAFAAPPDLTLPEAAALRDEAEVLRQIRHGVDPSLAASVRRGVIDDDAFVLTPLQAAIANHHAEVVKLLLDNGARFDATNVQELVCLAEYYGPEQVVPVLTQRLGSGLVVRCETAPRPF